MTKRSSSLAKKMRARLRRTKPACHICGEVIDYDLPYSDPMSFVVDHVTPITKGGEDHPSNMRAAHRECNSKKRARIVAPIVRRSGALN